VNLIRKEQKAASRFIPGHEDLVHDLSYDYYGRRLATCSSDRRLKIWDLEGSEWRKAGEVVSG